MEETNMIVIRENERLYLSNWEYNSCRILSELANIVDNHGGKVKPTKTAIVSNRTLAAAVRDLSGKLENMLEIQKNDFSEKRAAYIASKEKELEKCNAINNDPITVTHTSYISFVLDDVYYSYSTDANPFFEFYYMKTPVINDKRSQDVYLEKDNKEWLYDCFFSFSASNADVKEAANLIFNMLMTAKNSTPARNTTRKRVPNTYDGGYHYETIYEKERFENISEWSK
jgi:hypothetical protein